METQTLPATLSPAETATTELQTIMTDQTHRLHAAYMNGEASAHDHVRSLFRRAYPNDPATTPTLTDQEAQAAYDREMRQHFGDEYESIKESMPHGVRGLLSTSESLQAFNVLSDAITKLGPYAEFLSIRFLSDLGRIIKIGGA